jgi:hypothetical protein
MNEARAQVERIATQIGSTVLPDNERWVNRFTVKSTSSSSVYTVSQQRGKDRWECSCWGWKRHRHCKHVTDILSRLAKLPEDQLAAPAVSAMLLSARTAYLDFEDAAPIRQTATSVPQLDL